MNNISGGKCVFLFLLPSKNFAVIGKKAILGPLASRRRTTFAQIIKTFLITKSGSAHQDIRTVT